MNSISTTEPAVCQPGTLFRLRNDTDTDAFVLYVVSPSYLFCMERGSGGVRRRNPPVLELGAVREAKPPSTTRTAKEDNPMTQPMRRDAVLPESSPGIRTLGTVHALRWEREHTVRNVRSTGEYRRLGFI
jgi:hypothetical protein